MQNKGGPRLLATDREGALYLERARVHVEGHRVVYHIVDDEHAREFNIPHVNLAVLFLGQGTSITQEAVRLLGEEHVHLAVTGSGGTPLHMGALTTYTATGHFRRLLPVYEDPDLSLVAAVSVMRDRIARMRSVGIKLAERHLRARNREGIERVCERFDDALGTCSDTKELLGHEGVFSKGCYREFGKLARLPSFRRSPGAGPSGDPADDDAGRARVALANSLIDHGNYLCYGIAGAALWALGIPPHLPVFHGKTRPGGLVFDVADAFKDSLVLPFAFAVAGSSRDGDPEGVFRARMISAFDDHKILAATIDSIESMLRSAESSRA